MGTLSLPVRLALPEEARAGSVVSLRLLLQHPMETGYRIGEDGARIPRHLLTALRVTYGDRVIATLTLRPAIAANPYFALSFIADQTGPVSLEVEDDRGRSLTETRMLTVVP
jgi:sulfur-oxidizing protein SoxZ